MQTFCEWTREGEPKGVFPSRQDAGPALRVGRMTVRQMQRKLRHWVAQQVIILSRENGAGFFVFRPQLQKGMIHNERTDPLQDLS